MDIPRKLITFVSCDYRAENMTLHARFEPNSQANAEKFDFKYSIWPDEIVGLCEEILL